MNVLLWFMACFACLQSGMAKEYSPGVMEHVYKVRITQGLAAPGWTGGLISRPSCGTIGRVYQVSFRNPRTGQYSAWRPMLQVDCAQYRDYRRQIAEGLIVESDYQTAVETGWARYGRTRAILKER